MINAPANRRRVSDVRFRWLLCAGYARLLVGALRERTSFLKLLQWKTA